MMTKDIRPRPGWEPSLDENETPWGQAGVAIAVLAIGGYIILALAIGATDRLVSWLLG